MKEVKRRHCQSSTLHPAGLLARYRSNRPLVPLVPGSSSSPVEITTAAAPPGRYQNFGSGLVFRLTYSIMFTSSRCCSSACGIDTLDRSTQSGADEPPKNRSSDRIG